MLFVLLNPFILSVYLLELVKALTIRRCAVKLSPNDEQVAVAVDMLLRGFEGSLATIR